MSKDAPLSFEAAIQHLQATAGESSESLKGLKEAILAMAENEQSERDTHFVGFAKLLYDEMEELSQVRPMLPRREMERLIAQRAYDLVIHAVTHAFPSDLNIFHRMGGTKEFPWEQFFKHIPDLTEWPDTSPQPPQ